MPNGYTHYFVLSITCQWLAKLLQYSKKHAQV